MTIVDVVGKYYRWFNVSSKTLNNNLVLEFICLDWWNEVPNINPKEGITWTDIVVRNNRKWRSYWSWNGFIISSFTSCCTKLRKSQEYWTIFLWFFKQASILRWWWQWALNHSGIFRHQTFRGARIYFEYIIILGHIFYRARTSFKWHSKRLI